MKKLLIITMLLSCSLTGSAQTTFTVDNLSYFLEDDQEGGGIHAVVARQNGELISGEVVIPATVTYEGTAYAVTRIEYEAFSGCTGMTAINLPEGITVIGVYAFLHCNKLSSITIPNSVTRIEGEAFENCTNLTKVVIGRNVTNFDNFFSGCTNISEVWCYTTTVPNIVSKAFEESVYANASLFVRSSLIDNYKDVEPWNSFKEIKEISDLQDYAPYHTLFVAADGVRYMTEDDEAVIARQDRELSGDIVIPETVTYEGKEYTVTRLMDPSEGESGGGGAFQECNITGITLPESITNIPDNTFWHCEQLSSVSLHGAVRRIGSYSFESCKALTTIELPDAVTEMGDGAFLSSGLTEFKIPAGVTMLNWSVLANTNISYLEIPASVNYLCGACFATNKTDEDGQPVRRTVKMFQRDCRLVNGWDDRSEFGNMTAIDLLVPKGSKVLYKEYFPWLNMHSITEYGEDSGEPLVPEQRHVTIEGLCYMLKDGEAHVDIQPATLSGEVTIPEKVIYEDVEYPVTTIMSSYGGGWLGTDYYEYSSVFSQTQVTKVILPTSIKTIGHHAFCKSPLLQEVVLNEGITEIGNAAFGFCPELTTINIPSSVSVLKSGLLRGCSKLTTLSLHEGLTSIDGEVLWDTGIETLTIPSTCTSFGYQALQIPNLKTLYMNVKEPTDIRANGNTMNGTVFGHDSDQEETNERLSKADLIVPLGCAQVYKSLAPWFHFRSITDQGSPYLKLNNSAFSAPEGAFTITNTGNNGEPEFEAHDGWFIDTFTHGLCMKEGTSVSFNTTGTSWIYVYLSSDKTSTVTIDGKEMELSDDRPDDYHYRRYDLLVEGAGKHILTCGSYENNQWPCVFRVEVQNISSDYYQPKTVGVNINGINYVLHETINDQNETIRTATIASQSTSLSGDITIPAKVSYARTVLQNNKWVALEAHDYDVTDIVLPGFEIAQVPGNYRTTGGAFQESQITSISLPATITVIPAGTFNGCKQLKTVTLAEGITTLGGGAFANCSSLEEIYLPETITDMSGWYIFGNCPSLKKVNIPKLVTSIGNGCFMRSGIETFIVPKNVTSIGEACFGALGEETCVKSFKICHESYSDGSFSFPENIFNDIDDITLIVPQGTKESFYSQIYPWKNFKNIIEYTDQNDEHQYNNYRVEIAEQAPAASRGMRKANSTVEPVTVGFTPSGVGVDELPTEIEKNGKKYLVKYKNIPEIMPAEDVVLEAVLTVKGDIDGDGELSVTDVVSLVNAVMDPSAVSDITKYDMDGDGNLTITDVVMLVNSTIDN